jgi:malate/lactate dehydrogenase
MIFQDIRFKITVLGVGHVGTAIAQLLLGTRDFPLDINLVDPSSDTRGSMLDLAHACTAIGLHTIRFNDRVRLEEADLIFHSAGVNSSHGSSRHTVAQENVDLTRSIFEGLNLKSHCRIIVIPIR